MRTLIAWFVMTAAVLAADYPVDWEQVHAETLEHFVALLKIDTTNPPGNETKAAEYVKQVLERDGISSKLLGPDPSRLNLVARFRGDGSKKPILIMGHTDVVGVQREKWTAEPFGGELRDGFIYGRGSVDDKDNVVAGLMVMMLLKRHDVKLSRDVIFVAESGEESGAREGFRYLVANHWDEIEAEFALAEGGGGKVQGGKVQYITVAASEKVGAGVRLVVKGTSGHASVPLLGNPVAHLARAVARAAEWQPPMRLSPIARTYFERLAEISPPEQAERYRQVLDPSTAAEAEKYFRENEPRHNSILRTSVSPTRLEAGFRNNVIPSEAEAYLDIRAVPEENIEEFYAMLREVIDDPTVEIVTRQRQPPPPSSSLDSDMFRALEKTQETLYPGAVTLPAMLTGGTDMKPIRAKGVQAYGIGPLSHEEDGSENGAHTDDERIREAELHRFVAFLWHTVLEIAGP
jgi:acetylornithine deacetylase/succinyl-diaminopimelate desuccinylase-like protein